MAAATEKIAEKDLHSWKLVADFRERLARVWAQSPQPSSWENPQRLLAVEDYLSLFLLGLFNPVVRTLRGLCAASQLGRVQREVCTRAVSLGSFSEAQHLVEPALLEKVFLALAQEVQQRPPPGQRCWLIQDSSLFQALPRMHWALWRRQGQVQAQVRLHLSLALETQNALRATVSTGRGCERAAWEAAVRPGDAYVGDRYYSENYRLLERLDDQGVVFVVRLREDAVTAVEQPLERSAPDQQAKVWEDAWVRLGCKRRYRTRRFRQVRVRTERGELRLLTNLGPAELSGAEIALLYKQRWSVELFFRWIKYVLGCRHWLAESRAGTTLQLYLALIAGLFLQLYSGQRPTKRMVELLQFYTLGIASLDEVEVQLRRLKARPAKKS